MKKPQRSRLGRHTLIPSPPSRMAIGTGCSTLRSSNLPSEDSGLPTDRERTKQYLTECSDWVRRKEKDSDLEDVPLSLQ